MSAPVRRIAFTPLESPGRAEAVARQLGDSVRLGLLADGEKLPPEPELAAELGVAMATLRDALRLLRELGLVSTQRGRGGGTYVTAPAKESKQRLRTRLTQIPIQELRDLADFRGAIYPRAAELATDRGSEDNHQRLRSLIADLSHATELGAMRRADGLFRLEVAASSQSVRLTKAEIAVQSEIGDLLWLPLGDSTPVAKNHLRLVEAMEKGNRDQARGLAAERVASEMRCLIDLRLDLTRRNEPEEA